VLARLFFSATSDLMHSISLLNSPPLAIFLMASKRLLGWHQTKIQYIFPYLSSCVFVTETFIIASAYLPGIIMRSLFSQ